MNETPCGMHCRAESRDVEQECTTVQRYDGTKDEFTKHALAREQARRLLQVRIAEFGM